MPINNIFDVYNATLEADRPYAEEIIDAIKALLETKVEENINVFDYDCADIISELPATQKNRIVERVIFAFRKAGIRIMIKRTNLIDNSSTLPPYAAPYYNIIGDGLTLLTISWWTRNSQEYMKTYV